MQPRWLPSSHRRDSFEPAPVLLAGLGVERGQGARALHEKNTAAWSVPCPCSYDKSDDDPLQIMG